MLQLSVCDLEWRPGRRRGKKFERVSFFPQGKGKKMERINFHIVNIGPRLSNLEIYRPALILPFDLAYHNGLLMIEKYTLGMPRQKIRREQMRAQKTFKAFKDRSYSLSDSW